MRNIHRNERETSSQREEEKSSSERKFSVNLGVKRITIEDQPLPEASLSVFSSPYIQTIIISNHFTTLTFSFFLVFGVLLILMFHFYVIRRHRIIKI